MAATINIVINRSSHELALMATREARFERNQTRWVKLIVEGKAPYSSHTLEALQRRKSFLKAWVADQSKAVQRQVEKLLTDPEWATVAGKTLKDSGVLVEGLVNALRDVDKATELVTAYLAEYPAESTDPS